MWLASEAAAQVSGEIFHAVGGRIGIMQQPAIIKSFTRETGLWTQEELDAVVPELLAARKANVEAAEQSTVG